MISQTLIQEITTLHADFCSALADATRLILLYALADDPRNVTELTLELNQPQPTISRHLENPARPGIGDCHPAGHHRAVFDCGSQGHRCAGYFTQHHARQHSKARQFYRRSIDIENALPLRRLPTFARVYFDRMTFLKEEGMHHRKLAFWLISAGTVFLVTTALFFLLPAQPVSAQCGSQASSCKNCHETQGQGPVNNDLTTWHGQHAFGDFCYLCHGGNNQAMDKTAAHIGLVYPLEDIVISCKSCHPDDYEARAKLYADTLGIKAGSMKATLAATQSQPAAAVPTPAATAIQAGAAAAIPAAVIPAADIVDYSQRYAEVASGKKPVNVGNAILIVLIAAMLLGGGFFVARRENLFKISFQETKQIQDSYPADVVDMVPALARLKPAARKDLGKLLARPTTAADLFALATRIADQSEEPSVPADEKEQE